MGCNCGKGVSRFDPSPPAHGQAPATGTSLSYDPRTGEAPVRREGSVFWDGKTARSA